MIDPSAYIHPAAVTDETITVGARTKIWSGALVRAGTVIGSDCSIGIGCALEGCTIGNNVGLNPYVLAGPGLVIEDDCWLGGHTVLANDCYPARDPKAHGGWHTGLPVTVVVERGAIIGTNAVILPGSRLGRRSMVAAGAIFSGSLPPDHMALRGGRIKPIDYSRIRRMIPVPPPFEATP